MRRRALLALLGVLAVSAPAAHGQEPPKVRFAASVSCPANPGCILGLKRVYKLDATAFLVPIEAGEAIGALDAGTADVGIAFSTNPAVSRPDIVALRDDKHMIGTDHIVPVIRSKAVDRVGRGALRALDAASAQLT